MKTCPTCRVHYPDALDFCPQDGTNLSGGAGRTQALYDRFLGTVVDGRYKIESKLGEGGMGVVYAARHVIIDKRVAIKVLKKEAQNDETAGQRFIQEARSASKIGHPNIVDITDFGTLPDGSAYFVMEFLEGKTLGELLHDGPVPAKNAISIAAQTARGLQAAHKNDIVHRDLKPDNIFLIERDGQHDQVKIVDFGIARVLTATAGPRLTQAGMVLGTPEYMAPEAATGKETDHRVDEYSLGCILYEMLTGVVPFKGENSAATLTKQVFEAVVPPRKRRSDLDIPVGIQAVTLKAMAKKPDDRYPSMRELLEALDGAASEVAIAGPSVRSQPRGARGGLIEVQDGGAARGGRLPRDASDTLLADDIGSAARGSPLLKVGIAGSVVVSLGLVSWLALGLVSGRTQLPRHATAQRTPSPPASPPLPPSPVETSPPAAAAPAPPVEVTLTLRTAPPNADVYRDGEIIGATPLVVHHPREASPLVFVFKLAGYKDVERSLVPDANHDVEVALPPKRAGRPANASSDGSRERRSRPRGQVTDLRDPFQ